MAEQKLTGYPSIDKPWSKYYPAEVKLNTPSCNVTRYLKDKSADFSNNVALTYYGDKIKYHEFWFEVDIASTALCKIGVKRNDRIMFLVPNIPESGYLWLGAAQIGAISDFIDPRPDTMDVTANSQKVLELLKYEKSKFIIALEQCYLSMLKPIESQISELGIHHIIILSAGNSMSKSGKIRYLRDVANYEKIALDKKGEKNSSIKAFFSIKKKLQQMKQFQKKYVKAKNESSLSIIEYPSLKKAIHKLDYVEVNDPNSVCYIGHTSGTSTGRPKPIPLTHNNLIFANEQVLAMGISDGRETKVLHILPFFAPFGASNNFLLNISRGSISIEVPEFQLSEVGYLLKRYKPHMIMRAPSWMISLIDCPYLKNENLSFLRHITYGGDSMTKSDEIALEKWLVAHNSKAKIVKGHGMSECCGCSSYSQGAYSRYEAIGIPLPGTIYTLVNPENTDELEEVKLNEGDNSIQGELIISSDAITPGIIDDEVIVPHYYMNGRNYIRTKDIVTMDCDGIFYFNSRKDRMFTRFDGYKYKPYIVESVIEGHSLVKYCRIVEYYDSFVHGNMAIAHIVLEETDSINETDFKDISETIIEDCFINNPNMSSRQIPRKIRYRPNLPLTKNSKVDFNELIKEGLNGTEMTVDVDEDNISVGNITILEPSECRVMI